MSRVTIDHSLLHELGRHAVPVELCDQAGRIVGHFVPISTSRRQQLRRGQCPYSEAELDEMHRATGGRTLAEIFQSLGITCTL